jgi:hypothetical protein
MCDVSRSEGGELKGGKLTGSCLGFEPVRRASGRGPRHLANTMRKEFARLADGSRALRGNDPCFASSFAGFFFLLA